MNKGTTIAFDNTAKVWKTRYSFVPTRYAYLDKKLLSCKGSQDDYDNSALVYRHDAKEETINKFYGEQFRSALKTSFNKDLSANKLYKSLSLEGTTNLKGGENRFLANSTSQKSHLRDAAVGKLREKGGILYADLGRGVKNSNSNVGVVGVITGISSLFSSSSQADKFGYSYDPSLVKIDINFLSSNFISSSEFKFMVALDSPGNTGLSGDLAVVSGSSYGDIVGSFVSAGGVTKVPGGLILRDPNYISPEEIVGDFNSDGLVQMQDLLELLASFGTDTDSDAWNPIFDLNNNGALEAQDLLLFLAEWGNSTSGGGQSGYLAMLNSFITASQANGTTLFAFVVTPNEVNGRDPKGQYADLFLNLGVEGTEDFELDVLNLNYEHTRLDHSS